MSYWHAQVRSRRSTAPMACLALALVVGALPVAGAAASRASAADADQTWEIGVVDHVSDGDPCRS